MLKCFFESSTTTALQGSTCVLAYRDRWRHGHARCRARSRNRTHTMTIVIGYRLEDGQLGSARSAHSMFIVILYAYLTDACHH